MRPSSSPRLNRTLFGLLGAALLVAGAASAEKVSLGPLTGPGAQSVLNQLRAALCDGAECVDAATVTTKGKPDWKKAKRAQVGTFVMGRVAKKGKVAVLTVEVYAKPGRPALKKQWAVNKGSLLPKDLAKLLEFVGPFVGAAPAQPPPAAAPPPPEPTPEPVVEARGPPPTPSEEPKAAPPKPAADRPSTQEAGAGPRERRRKDRTPRPFIALDVSGSAFSRSFDYANAVSGNLRRYELPFFPAPRLGLTITPFAPGRAPVLEGLGLEASADVQLWLKSQTKTNASVQYPSSFLRFDGGLRWKFALPTGFGLAVVPAVGFRRQSFATAAATDGTRLDGLPSLTFTGLRASLGLEVALLDHALLVWLRGSALPVFSAGEILSAAYFPKGSCFGFEGTAGVGVRLTSFLQVRAAFEFLQYGLSFTTQDSDTYRASGATERLLSGNLGLRLEF
jgi:hypothetical protein